MHPNIKVQMISPRATLGFRPHILIEPVKKYFALVWESPQLQLDWLSFIFSHLCLVLKMYPDRQLQTQTHKHAGTYVQTAYTNIFHLYTQNYVCIHTLKKKITVNLRRKCLGGPNIKQGSVGNSLNVIISFLVRNCS